MNLLGWLAYLAFCVVNLTCVLAKSNCEICKEITKQFQKGLDKTTKSNFGGGNTNWEEKSLGKWKTSETRLVEIVDHHLCLESSKDKCHMFLENNEESLEDWYFNIYAEEDSGASLYDHWCVESIKVCCPDGKFGKKCSSCKSNEHGLCNGRGKCEGDGTRTGDGSCSCDDGYIGDICDECDDEFYEVQEEGKLECKACHRSCEDTCSGEGPLGCDECTSGWQWEAEVGCKDLNECAAEHNCGEDKYCVNTEGSYSCRACSKPCNGCTALGAHACKECSEGYEKNDSTGSCTDIDECITNPCEKANTECENTPGLYKCKCTDGFKEEDEECIPKIEEPLPPAPPAEESTSEDKKGEAKQKTFNKKTKHKAKDETFTIGDDLSIINPNEKPAKIKKRKYRTLDTMVLISGTALYLVLCLVFNGETWKCGLISVIYGVFLYQYCGSF